MFEQIQIVVGAAWDLLFSMGKTTGEGNKAVTEGAGIVIKFLGFLQANPVLLLPLGFYLIFLGIKTVRKLITGY